MTHGGLTPEMFNDIAADTVKKYLAEVSAMSAANRPSFDELLSKLKTLNAELTIKAIKVIKGLHHHNINAKQNLVQQYQQIINTSVNVFVKQL